MLQAKDLLDVLDLLVLHDLLVLGVADIEQLSAQREHAEVVATDDAEPGDGERLGGVSFGEDERALLRLPGPGVVGVGQLGQAGEPGRVSAMRPYDACIQA